MLPGSQNMIKSHTFLKQWKKTLLIGTDDDITHIQSLTWMNQICPQDIPNIFFLCMKFIHSKREGGLYFQVLSLPIPVMHCQCSLSRFFGAE